MGFVFFKIPKARKFRYRPLVFKEGKDNRTLAQQELQGMGNRQEFERALNERWHRKDSMKRKSQGMTALIFLILLILILLWIIFL